MYTKPVFSLKASKYKINKLADIVSINGNKKLKNEHIANFKKENRIKGCKILITKLLR